MVQGQLRGTPDDPSRRSPLIPPLGERDLDQIQAGLRQLAHAHSRMRQLLDAVVSISSALDVDVVLHTIVDTARQLGRARYAALGVLDETGAFVQLIASGFGDGDVRDKGKLPHGAGLLGELIRHPEPLRVDNLAAHPRASGFPEGHPRMSTLLGVPIRVRDTVYGNLYLADKEGDEAFTDEDQEYLVALASAAGVAIENARLVQRLRQATEDFQRRLLPDLASLPGLAFQARYQPSTEAPRVGGDWYDVICLPDKVPCVMVGDVMGHGIEAATVMSRISNMIRVIAYAEGQPPSRVLHRLDALLHHLHDAPMATALVARIEPADSGEGRFLHWCSAGHLPPLLITPDNRARYLTAEAGPPLGVSPELTRPDHRHPLPCGATVLLHTDGLIEERGHSYDDGMRQVADTAARCATAPLEGLCDALLAQRQGTFHDDVALLAVRVAH
ncbi:MULTISPECIES: PP2C family protein-serine/threonine phosphatase [Streptomyces]|jgi:serine phosphatase RsbU (regulator of sigma subunit)|uniref:SpoIIE family protein phosphatase n=1 Tax=Streptomyces thermoviolaceus subsp. thermoviolaceus TaxID=66860 RepID=A0ABX0Z0G8_STRTL|nr:MULTISPECIES: GAF domain-containing SpoIIE family protein phosphatase [Streptomyces]NJP16909.1 SpoIIE family protein phosphatase [Streptomyces thermoviolaceus subsp. thermoviolaceus]WTD46611.1 SpoIIE family protein phosphatase [Streptomyces thermoviolaceus]GGV77079.1 hypothetical protein GCM10010499_35690 [Streptomyces thermoviolaceus subsp. apingens]GHB03187.1 hypothetical protein GCM10010512_38250 [Streptomyces thermoviolaceus subsp. thermoviolaceus]